MAKKPAVSAKTVKKPVAAKKATPAKVVKKAPAKKVVAEKKSAKPAVVGLPKNVKYESALTKTEMYQTIAEATGLTKKDVGAVLDTLGQIIHGHIRSKAVGVCTLAGLFKIEVKTKPASKARKGINPFTGQEMMLKAKPARQVVRVKALKKLKEMVG